MFNKTSETSPKNKGIKIKPAQLNLILKMAISQRIDKIYIMEADFNTEIGLRKQLD